AGETSTNCSKLTEEKSGKVTYRFEFGNQCHNVLHKAACVPSTQAHRSILVGAYHEALQQRRRDQQSEEFRLQMHQRVGLDGEKVFSPDMIRRGHSERERERGAESWLRFKLREEQQQKNNAHGSPLRPSGSSVFSRCLREEGLNLLLHFSAV